MKSKTLIQFWVMIWPPVRISYASKERGGHILRGLEGTMYQNKQVCGHQVYEEQLQQHRAGA